MYFIGCLQVFEFFPDRLGLGLVLPLYLDNDSFGVGMHAVSYFLTG